LLEKHIGDMGVYMVASIYRTWPWFLILSQQYCVNQSNAIRILQSLREAKPDLAAKLQHLRENDPSVRSLDLSSYLLIPMQRLTRYPLLIRQILNYTDPSVDREKIENSLIAAETILEAINESIREQEGQERLAELSKELWVGHGHLDLTAPTRFMGPRRLVKEGLLVKAKSGRRLRVVLCTDILILVQEATKTVYRNPIPLSDVAIHELPGGRGQSA
jgi:actin cytoskeleton-regulatory complex protein PAN1